jgi:hypothetical protein
MQTALKALVRARAGRELWRVVDAVGGYIEATMEARNLIGDVT